MKNITKNLVDDMFDNADLLWYLKDRWQDEKEYEDFSDYKDKVQKFVEEKGFVFVKMTKGFKITMEHLNTLITMKIKRNDVDVTFEEK